MGLDKKSILILNKIFILRRKKIPLFFILMFAHIELNFSMKFPYPPRWMLKASEIGTFTRYIICKHIIGETQCCWRTVLYYTVHPGGALLSTFISSRLTEILVCQLNNYVFSGAKRNFSWLHLLQQWFISTLSMWTVQVCICLFVCEGWAAE